MKHTAKVLLTVVLALAALLGCVLLGGRLYFRLPVSAYYRASKKAFVITGLSDGFVPQGLEYAAEENVFLVCGYQKDGAPTRVYRVDRQSGKETGFVTLADEDGAALSPHAGGLAAHGDYVYVAGDEEPYLYVYRLSDVLSAPAGEAVRRLGRFSVDFGGDGIRADFLCAAADRLIVGEFYREPNYPTPASHVFTAPSGETSHALALSFRFAEGGAFGLEEQPSAAYTLPPLVQGLALYDGQIWLSRSYSTAFSTVSAYDPAAAAPFAELRTADGDIPLRALDADAQTASLRLPPMAEEIVFVDGKLLTMCESASEKYYFGKLTGAAWCYATDVEKLL